MIFSYIFLKIICKTSFFDEEINLGAVGKLNLAYNDAFQVCILFIFILPENFQFVLEYVSIIDYDTKIWYFKAL